MSKNELIRKLRREGDTSVVPILRANGWLSADSNRTFGVEMEVVFPSRESVDDFCADVNNSTNQSIGIECYNHNDSTSRWKIVTDSSLRTTVRGAVTREIVSPILKGKSGKQALKAICKKLSEHGVKANIS